MAGRKPIFENKDLVVLSQHSPSSTEFKHELQKILNTPRETKKNVSYKTLHRLKNGITKLRGGSNETKITFDPQTLVQDLITMRLNSTSKETIHNFVKQKFKSRCSKSPNTRTIYKVLKKCEPDVEAGYSLLVLHTNNINQDATIEKEAMQQLKISSEEQSLTQIASTATNLCNQLAAEGNINDIGKDENSSNGIFATPTLKVSKKQKRSIYNKIESMQMRVAPNQKYKGKHRLAVEGNINNMGKDENAWSISKLVENNVSKKRKISIERQSAMERSYEVATVGKNNGIADNGDLVSQRSYHEAILTARVLLSPGNQPEPFGREDKIASITNVLVSSLRAIARGKVGDIEGRAGAEGVDRFGEESVSDVDGILNIYICGSPGIGKTLCIENLLRSLEARQGAAHSSSYISIPAFKVIRLQGTTVQTSKEFYTVLASRLQLDVGIGQSRDPRLAVLSLFRNPTGIATCKKKDPTTVLFIDEIDRAPAVAIREVLEIAGTSTEEIGVKAEAYNCNVVVIGAANNRLFCENVGISYSSQKHIYRCCFEHYDSEQLLSILKQRTEGLFDYRALKFLSLKVALADGDVRFLLQLADRCLFDTVKKLRLQIENKEEYEKSTDPTLFRPISPNPLANWKG